MTAVEKQACEDFASSSWASMDPKLKEAACCGDVDFLKSAIASSKPASYFLSRCRPASDNDDAGNILHLAIRHQRVEFVTEAVSALPEEIVRLLLCQQESAGRLGNWNPLHVAVYRKNSSPVELIANCANGEVSLYRESNGLKPLKPFPDQIFVAQDSEGRTPALLAIKRGLSESASILTSGYRAELIKNVVDHEGRSPLYWAVFKGLGEVVLNLLECQGPLCFRGPDGSTALHAMAQLSSAPEESQDEIYGKLLRRFPELITVTDEKGFTVLHKWAKIGYFTRRGFNPLRTFKYFFDHYPDVAVKLMLETDCDGNNPLHAVATSHITSDGSAAAIADKLMDLYEECTAVLTTQTSEIETTSQGLNLSQNHDWPWLMKNKDGDTPFLLALRKGLCALAWCFSQKIPIDFLSIGDQETSLMLAVHNGCSNLIPDILRITVKGGLTPLLTFSDESNILHLQSRSPGSQDKIYENLLRRFPKLVPMTDNQGFTVHEWARIVWRFNQRDLMRTVKYYIDHYPDVAVKLMLETDCNGKNVLHVIATSNTASDGSAAAIAEKLMDLYEERAAVLTTQTSEIETTSEGLNLSQNHDWPWLMKNKDGDTPLLLAIRKGLCALAWCFFRKNSIDFLSIGDQKTSLVLAVHNGCSTIVPDILRRMIEEGGLTPLLRSSDESNTLHLQSRSPEQSIEKVLEKFPSVIIQRDSRGSTPLDKASADGMESVVQLMLTIDPSSLKSSPSAWIKACENGRVSVILAFIKYCPNFRAFCHGRRDTPLHHIKLGSYEEYKEFLAIDKLIEEQKNTQDIDGATPLHKAIGREDVNLTEALLTDGADRTIKNKDDKTALDLLAEVCKRSDGWYAMCKRVGIDPRLTTAYVQRETNLLEMRGALSVVAGLLATITFTAGFTLPGGFDSATGEAVLAKNAAFLVFLLADTYAMCCSMLVLFCLIWSMLSNGDKSLLLIDRSVFILLQSLYATLVAFVTGVFTVIFHKSLWATIVVFAMCSVIGISATKRSILFWLTDKMVPSADAENGYQNRLLKALGKAFACKRTGSQESSAPIPNIV